MAIDRGLKRTGVETIVGHTSAPKQGAWHPKRFESPLSTCCRPAQKTGDLSHPLPAMCYSQIQLQRRSRRHSCQSFIPPPRRSRQVVIYCLEKHAMQRSLRMSTRNNVECCSDCEANRIQSSNYYLIYTAIILCNTPKGKQTL